MTTGNTTWPASLPFSSGISLAGRLSMLGGTLALTDSEVTFTPLMGLGRIRRFALADFDNVVAYADKPPRLRIALKQGRVAVLMVLASPTEAVWTSDMSARDEAVAAINARLVGG